MKCNFLFVFFLFHDALNVSDCLFWLLWLLLTMKLCCFSKCRALFRIMLLKYTVQGIPWKKTCLVGSICFSNTCTFQHWWCLVPDVQAASSQAVMYPHIIRRLWNWVLMRIILKFRLVGPQNSFPAFTQGRVSGSCPHMASSLRITVLWITDFLSVPKST